MSELKLIALDDEDLGVLSAHLQDAVLRVADLAYLKAERRFAMVVNRFNWASPEKDDDDQFTRLRAALRFEKVLSAQVTGLNLKDTSRVLSLMAITFETTEEPAGVVRLVFSGDAAIRLEVECVEAELRDLGAQWATKKKPDHPDDL